MTIKHLAAAVPLALSLNLGCDQQYHVTRHHQSQAHDEAHEQAHDAPSGSTDGHQEQSTGAARQPTYSESLEQTRQRDIARGEQLLSDGRIAEAKQILMRANPDYQYVYRTEWARDRYGRRVQTIVWTKYRSDNVVEFEMSWSESY